MHADRWYSLLSILEYQLAIQCVHDKSTWKLVSDTGPKQLNSVFLNLTYITGTISYINILVALLTCSTTAAQDTILQNVIHVLCMP